MPTAGGQQSANLMFLQRNQQRDIALELTDADTSARIASKPLRRATIRAGSGSAQGFTIGECRTVHVRHRHKYADLALPMERRFYFRQRGDHRIAPAGSMHDSANALAHVDTTTLQYHLERGDFSRWLEGAIADSDFAAQVAEQHDECTDEADQGVAVGEDASVRRRISLLSRSWGLCDQIWLQIC